MQMESLTGFEIGLLIMIALGLPVVSYLFHLQDKREREQGIAFDRIRSYRQTLAFLWIPTVILFGYWVYAGRSFNVLGVTGSNGLAAMIVWVVIAIIGVFMVLQVWAAHRKPSFAQDTVDQFSTHETVDRIMPRNARELAFFVLLSITAGITEEMMFRAFLIWALEHWVPVWAAALLSLASFTAAHFYQENASLIARVALAGSAFTLVYLISGSIWPAVVLHIFVDVAAGATIYAARRTVERENTQLRPQKV